MSNYSRLGRLCAGFPSTVTYIHGGRTTTTHTQCSLPFGLVWGWKAWTEVTHLRHHGSNGVVVQSAAPTCCSQTGRHWMARLPGSDCCLGNLHHHRPGLLSQDGVGCPPQTIACMLPFLAQAHTARFGRIPHTPQSSLAMLMWTNGRVSSEAPKVPSFPAKLPHHPRANAPARV